MTFREVLDEEIRKAEEKVWDSVARPCWFCRGDHQTQLCDSGPPHLKGITPAPIQSDD